MLGARLVQQKRAAAQRPPLGAHVAGRDFPISVAAGNGDCEGDLSDGVRHRVPPVGVAGHHHALADHVPVADRPQERVSRGEYLETQETGALRPGGACLRLLLHQPAGEQTPKEDGRLLRHHVPRERAARLHVAHRGAWPHPMVQGHGAHADFLFLHHWYVLYINCYKECKFSIQNKTD